MIDRLSHPPDDAPMDALTIEGLARFMGVESPAEDLFGAAITQASTAAQSFVGRPLPLPHPSTYVRGVQLLAAQLLITNRLDAPPEIADVPPVVRYWLTLASA